MQRVTNSGCTSVKTRKSLMPRPRISSSRLLDPGKILDPERDRRMREQAECVILARDHLAARILALGHVLDRDQDARPAFLVAGQDLAMQLDIEALAGQAVVHGVAVEGSLALPELHQFLDMGGQHVVAEHRAEIGDEMRRVRCLEQAQGLAVDLDQADAGRAFPHARGIGGEMGAQIGNALRPPALEHGLELAVILQPQRHRREIEHFRVVIHGPERLDIAVAVIFHDLQSVRKNEIHIRQYR